MASLTPELAPAAPRSGLRPAIFAAALGGALLALGVALWAHFGVAAFHEMIVAGLANCF